MTWKPSGLSKRHSLRIGARVYRKRISAVQCEVTAEVALRSRVEKRTMAVRWFGNWIDLIPIATVAPRPSSRTGLRAFAGL